MSGAPQGRFLTGSTMGHVVRMTMTGAVGITFIFLVDAANLFWISLLGDAQLMAAIGFGFAVQYLSISVSIGLMIAATAVVSRSIGAGDRDRARQQATGAAIIAAAVQTAVALLIVLYRHDILALVGAEGRTATLAARYLALSVPSLPIMGVAMVANGTLRALGDGRRAMYVTLASGGVVMLIEPVLIYVLALGLDGAAIGINLSRVVMLAMALWYAIGTHDSMAQPSWQAVQLTLRPYLVIALPATLTQLATPVGNYLLTGVMAQFGDEAMAGWAVVGRLTVVAFGGIFSLSGAIGGIFGQNFGARQYDRLRQAYRDALLFGLIYTLAAWGLLILVSPSVSQIFGLTPLGQEVVRAYTHIGAGGFLFGGALFVSNAAFNALGKPVRSTLCNWARDGVLTLPVALVMAQWFQAPGVIYAQAVAVALVGVPACLWGWRYVQSLARQGLPPLDLDPPRSYAHADRFRRR